MKIKNWLKKQAVALAISLSNVEKKAINQNGVTLTNDSKSETSHAKGTLADALKKGELTEEVRRLRWRMYKVLDELDNNSYPLKTVINERGEVLVGNSARVGDDSNLISVDNFDKYPVQIIYLNKELTEGIGDASDDIEEHIEDGKTIWKVEGLKYNKNLRTKRSLLIVRDIIARFDLESYAKKVVIRTINEKEKLIEFYVSKYPTYNINSTLFIRDVKKAMEEGPRNLNFLEINEVGFISDNSTLGVKPRLLFGYNITSFDKIVEYDGNYVIKFRGEVVVDGDSITEDFRDVVLDEKYEKKDLRK